jgi:arsenite-transporting ATPase
VLDDVNRLVANLIAMNETLRDREHVSIRLVMNPDRMVIDEARRTFTYLNLYGFLTDAVVVNRVFPEEVGEYFDAWRERQQAQLRDVEAAFAPVPVLCAPYFDHEVQGAESLDRLGEALFASRDPAGVLHDRLAHELVVERGRATLRLDLPFADKGAISLKKIGLELVVRVNGHKRTILLPAALGDYRPANAAFADGALLVEFEQPTRQRNGRAPALAQAPLRD